MITRRILVSVLGLALLAASAGCGGGSDEPAAEGTPTATGSTPASSITPAPSQTADADLSCLVSGSPWHVSKPDLESQFEHVLHGINITSVHIDGDQTLTVGSDLDATFADTTTTTIKAAMGSGITMVMVQKHRGQAAGTLRANGNNLTSDHWTGGIRGTTKVTINGRAAQAPFQSPTSTLGGHPMTYSCADGTLNLSVQGSPFQYLFTSS